MMKKCVVPLLLFVAAFLTGLLCAGHIFIHWGQFSLFLLTPDYFAQVFREPFPVCRLLLSFVLQFFDIPAVGPLVVAAAVAAVYAAVFALLRKLRVSSALSQALLSGAVVAACVAVAVSPSVKEKNCRYAVEQYARQHQWDKVLHIADPYTAGKDRALIPYALLALNAKGQLISGMNEYPLRGPQDLDMEGVQTGEGYWFSSILDECLGNYNEALHHLFQASCTLPQGMSQITLYQLIRFNMENENYTLARKYARILKRNPRNCILASKLLKTLEGKPDREDTPEPDKAAAPVTTDAPMYNLAALHQAGIKSDLANERLAAYMKLSEKYD